VASCYAQGLTAADAIRLNMASKPSETATIMLVRLRRLAQRLLQVGDELQGAGVVGTLRQYALEVI